MELSQEARDFFAEQGRKGVEAKKLKYGGEEGFLKHMKFVSHSRKKYKKISTDTPLA